MNNYIIRASENLLNSVNVGAYEYLIKKYLSKKDKDLIKKNVLKNLNVLLLIFSFLIFAFFLISLKYFIKKKNDHKLLFFLGIYLLMLFLTSVVYFRKDICMALAFISSILLAHVVIDLIKIRKVMVILFLITFFSPSIIYIFGGMQYAYGDYNKSTAREIFLNYKNLSQKELKILNLQDLNSDLDFKYYYFFKNLNKYKIELNSIDKKNLITFHDSFAKHQF